MPNSQIINSERSVVLAPPPKLPSPSHLPQKPGTTLIVDRYLRQKKLDIHDNHSWPALRQGRARAGGLACGRGGMEYALPPDRLRRRGYYGPSGVGVLGQRPEMGPLPVVVEDAQDLRRAAVSPEGVRNHGGELRRLAGLDHDGPLAKQQHYGSRQDGEPVLAGMDFQLSAARGRWPGDPHLRQGASVRAGLAAEHPGGHPAPLMQGVGRVGAWHTRSITTSTTARTRPANRRWPSWWISTLKCCIHTCPRSPAGSARWRVTGLRSGSSTWAAGPVPAPSPCSSASRRPTRSRWTYPRRCCAASRAKPTFSAVPTGSGRPRRAWTRDGRVSARPAWCGRLRRCTIWPIPIGSWPRSWPPCAPAGG